MNIQNLSMNNQLSHFAIYVDDVCRAQQFYQKLFHWDFNAYGPEDFLQINTNEHDGGKLIGALQSRNYSPIRQKVNGFECSISVMDIHKIADSVENAGGEIVLPITSIPGVGWIIKFLDTEGNLLCAIQYDQKAS